MTMKCTYTQSCYRFVAEAMLRHRVLGPVKRLLYSCILFDERRVGVWYYSIRCLI